MANPKINHELWLKARILYENNESYGEIARQCPPLDKSNIAKKAKKEGWQKGVLPPLIQDKVRVETEITTLDLPRQQFITTEVNKILDAKAFYEANARKVAHMAMMSLESEPTTANAKTVMEVLHKGLVVEGAVPYYPNATTINNTQATQVINKPKSLAEFYGEQSTEA